MKPIFITILKTAAAAAATAAIHELATSWPTIQALIPPHWAGLGAAVGAGITLYLANSPRKS